MNGLPVPPESLTGSLYAEYLRVYEVAKYLEALQYGGERRSQHTFERVVVGSVDGAGAWHVGGENSGAALVGVGRQGEHVRRVGDLHRLLCCSAGAVVGRASNHDGRCSAGEVQGSVTNLLGRGDEGVVIDTCGFESSSAVHGRSGRADAGTNVDRSLFGCTALERYDVGRSLSRDASLGLGQDGGKLDTDEGTQRVDGTNSGEGTGSSNSLKRGKNYEKNREKKRRRNELRARKSGTEERVSQGEAVNRVWRSARVEKQKKSLFESGRHVQTQGHFSDLPEDDQKTLKSSYAARLQAENELKLFRARQQLELEKAKDFTQLKKRQETQIMRQTELNKVQVEKAFAQLARADNVPGVVGLVKTVVSDSSSSSPLFSGVGSGTISPNSSASAAEVHAVHREILEKTHENEKLRARLDKLKVVNPVVYTELGFDKELPPTVGTGVTVDAHGDPIIGGFEEGGSDVFGYDGYVGDDGRFHFGENPAIYDA